MRRRRGVLCRLQRNRRRRSRRRRQIPAGRAGWIPAGRGGGPVAAFPRRRRSGPEAPVSLERRCRRSARPWRAPPRDLRRSKKGWV